MPVQEPPIRIPEAMDRLYAQHNPEYDLGDPMVTSSDVALANSIMALYRHNQYLLTRIEMLEQAIATQAQRTNHLLNLVEGIEVREMRRYQQQHPG